MPARAAATRGRRRRPRLPRASRSASAAAPPGRRRAEAAARAAPATRDGRIKASPLARRIARERGIDLAALSGTGPEGRIVAEDVERAAGRARAAGGRAPRLARPAEVERDPARRRPQDDRAPPDRGVAGARLPDLDVGRHDAPHQLAARSSSRAAGTRSRRSPTCSRRPARSRCCATARVNALFAGDAIELHPRRTSGSRSRSTAGLVVPVIRGAERLSIAEIAAARGASSRAPATAAPAGGSRGRHVHDLEPRHVRRRAVHRRAQPAAGRDPRGRRDRGHAPWSRTASGGPAADVDDADVRPPRPRRRDRRPSSSGKLKELLEEPGLML